MPDKNPFRPVWRAIRRRCTVEGSQDYPQYGARGITMYSQWLNDFEAFEVYIENTLGPKPKGYSLDRIDNSKGYEPGNLRWSSPKTQSRNRRDNVIYTYKGVTKTLTEWAEEYGLDVRLVWQRINRDGRDFITALTTPKR